MSIRSQVSAALIAVALLAGCSNQPSHTGAAVVVGQNKISERTVTSQLEEAIAQLAANPIQGQAPDTSTFGQLIVNRLVFGELMQLAIDKAKINVRESQVTQFQDQLYTQYGQSSVESQLLAQGVPESQIRGYLRLYVSQGELGKVLAPNTDAKTQSSATFSYLSELASKAGVTVSPRYGIWDPAQLSATGVDNTLSGLAPTK